MLEDINIATSQAPNTVLTDSEHNYVFYMLPQILTGKGVQVYIHFTDNTSITATLSGEWKAGTTKTYKLSNTTSTWTYTLQATSPASVAYNVTTTGNYKVTSYRTAPNGQQQPVAWEVVGYDADGDGTFAMEEKPAWLTALNKTSGNGGTAAETGTATLQTDYADVLQQRIGELRTAPAKGSTTDYYDLSMHDAAGNTTARNTANSYLISAQGHYKLPVVYGNAIKDGATNESAYKTTHTGTNILSNFKDHAWADITDPWITRTNSGANMPDGAKLVWADVKGVFTDIQLMGDGDEKYIGFSVGSNLTYGNAVLAVTKGGTVLWTWHIWIAPANALGVVEITNHEGVKYNITNLTLGGKITVWESTTYETARSVQVKIMQTVGNGEKQFTTVTITQDAARDYRRETKTLYQWGRHTALPGETFSSSKFEGSYTEAPLTGSPVSNGISPDRFFISNTNYNNYAKYLNLWSMENTTTTYNNNPVVKTVYDPCPAGFHVPAANAFTGFTSTGDFVKTVAQINCTGSWYDGWYFYTDASKTTTVYFNATGYRQDGRGNYVSGFSTNISYSSGTYWLATPSLHSGKTESIYFRFGGNFASPWTKEFVGRSGYGLGNAFAVRPVAD